MKWDGRYLVIGFAAGDIPKVPLNLPLLKNCSIVGVFYGMWRFNNQEEAYAQIEEISAMHKAGIINPAITKRYTLEQTGKCLRDFADRKVTGKVVIVIDDSKAKL
jgi:NADPH2:quinone reductase